MGTIVALLAVIVSCTVYILIARREMKSVRSIADYLPLRRTLTAAQYRGTTVAAGMSLATVMIALINLGPIFGVSLLITVATYCIGFVLLLRFIDRIMQKNPENLALPEYVGRQYDSPGLGKVAGGFVFVGYLSIFAMELLVGVTIMEPFFPNAILAFAGVYFLFLVTYTWLSGFRGIVATDVWQLRFVWGSIAALAVFFVLGVVEQGATGLVELVQSEAFTTWQAPFSFCVGIAVMNIPAPLSDTSTWQRVCATQEPESVRRGLRGAIGSFAVLWGAIILLGIFLPVTRLSPEFGSLPPIGQVLGTMGTSTSGLVQVLLFVFILGLFSAMVSTADSLLLAATHISLPSSKVRAIESGVGSPLRAPRLTMVAIASASFLLFLTFRMLGLNVLQLVFAIYGAQLALFPAVFLTLSKAQESNLTQARRAAALSIATGFVAAWGSAVYGRLSDNSDALFFAPVVGLVGAALVLFVGLIVSRRASH